MKTFKDFMKEIKSTKTGLQRLQLGHESRVNACLGMAIGPIQSASKSNATKFAQQVNSIVESDQFISDVSERIGTPHTAETENEFVKRAKDAMGALLLVRLGR
jgi:hypothetical protein